MAWILNRRISSNSIRGGVLAASMLVAGCGGGGGGASGGVGQSSERLSSAMGVLEVAVDRSESDILWTTPDGRVWWGDGEPLASERGAVDLQLRSNVEGTAYSVLFMNLGTGQLTRIWADMGSPLSDSLSGMQNGCLVDHFGNTLLRSLDGMQVQLWPPGATYGDPWTVIDARQPPLGLAVRPFDDKCPADLAPDGTIAIRVVEDMGELSTAAIYLRRPDGTFSRAVTSGAAVPEGTLSDFGRPTFVAKHFVFPARLASGATVLVALHPVTNALRLVPTDPGFVLRGNRDFLAIASPGGIKVWSGFDAPIRPVVAVGDKYFEWRFDRLFLEDVRVDESGQVAFGASTSFQNLTGPRGFFFEQPGGLLVLAPTASPARLVGFNHGAVYYVETDSQGLGALRRSTAGKVSWLTTASPVSLATRLAIPGAPSTLSFDHRFLTEAATLGVFLGGARLCSFAAPSPLRSEMTPAACAIDPAAIPAPSPGATPVLRFTLDGPKGQSWVVDNVKLNGELLPNGAFDLVEPQTGYPREFAGTRLAVNEVSGPGTPIAAAGDPQTVRPGETVTLRGGGVSTDGSVLRFAWTQTAGPTVQLSDPALAEPTFVAPAGPATLDFRIVVSAGAGSAAAITRVAVAGESNRPPDARCRSVSVCAEAQSCAADASIDNGSSDPDGDSVTLAQTPPAPYSRGTTAVMLSVGDGHSASSSCPGSVTVKDCTAPVVTAVGGGTLWPPNGKLVTVDLVTRCGIAIQDSCDGRIDPATAQVTAACITSDEPEGHDPSMMIVGGSTVSLRAERLGGGDGRVYWIHFTARDAAGNEGTGSCRVAVPHDQSTAPAIDSGVAATVGTCR